MDGTPFANLSLKIDPAVLRTIIEKGDLLKFAETVSAQAASQISAQIAWHVAEAQGRPQEELERLLAEVSFVLSDGEPGFGTGRFPPRLSAKD